MCTPCHLVTKPHAAAPPPPGLSLLFREKHSVQWCRTVQGDVTVAASFAPVLSFARWPRAQPHCRLGNRMQKRLNTGRLTEETPSDLATQARARKYRKKKKCRRNAHNQIRQMANNRRQHKNQRSQSNKTAKVFPVDKIGLSRLYTLLPPIM